MICQILQILKVLVFFQSWPAEKHYLAQFLLFILFCCPDIEAKVHQLNIVLLSHASSVTHLGIQFRILILLYVQSKLAGITTFLIEPTWFSTCRCQTLKRFASFHVTIRYQYRSALVSISSSNVIIA